MSACEKSRIQDLIERGETTDCERKTEALALQMDEKNK